MVTPLNDEKFVVSVSIQQEMNSIFKKVLQIDPQSVEKVEDL